MVATFASQALLRRSIRKRDAPARLYNARDVGVSYFVLGVAGALTRYVQERRRVQAVATAGLVVNAAVRPTFTEFGHLTAFAVGLAATPLLPAGERCPSLSEA